jgi:hypothetical protein
MRNIHQTHAVSYPTKLIGLLDSISILGIIYFSISVALLHLLDSSVNPLTHGISYYAVGPYENLMTAAFIILGLGGLALTTGLYLALPVKARSLAGLALLGLWSFATVLAGIFPLDAEGASPTTSGVIHNITGMNFLCIAVAAMLISRRLKHDRRWWSVGKTAMWLALAVIIASLLLFILLGPLHSLGVGGVAQRVYWAAVLIWLLFVAIRLREIGTNQNSSMEA